MTAKLWWQDRSRVGHDPSREFRMAARRFTVACWQAFPFSLIARLPAPFRGVGVFAVIFIPPLLIELVLNWACGGQCFAG